MDNTPKGLWVDFALQGTEFSGVADGVFSGTFSFTVRQTAAGVPDGGNGDNHQQFDRRKRMK
ncbi:MAG: hypothetical protein U1G07_17240 [Verrucomicrobiota bacterium]